MSELLQACLGIAAIILAILFGVALIIVAMSLSEPHPEFNDTRNSKDSVRNPQGPRDGP